VLLREYLNNNHLPAKSLAEKSGIDAVRIGRLLRDTSPRVSVTMAVALERATDGEVPVTSWAEVAS
jgi:plasmid maintenance system antidote protein VapI